MLDWTLFEVGHCLQMEMMTRRGGRLAIIEFPALVALVRHPTSGLMLFDTGYSGAFFTHTVPFPERFYRWATPVRLAKGQDLVGQLADRGVRPQDIDTIFVSHGHADHVAGLRHFPSSRVLMSSFGRAIAASRSRFANVRKGVLPALFPSRSDSIEAAPLADLGPDFAAFERGYDLFGDGSCLAVSLPGHGDGQFGLFLPETKNGPTFFIADAAWSIEALRDNQPPPALTNGLLHDGSAYLKTFGHLRTLIENRPDIIVVPSHCRTSRDQFVRPHHV